MQLYFPKFLIFTIKYCLALHPMPIIFNYTAQHISHPKLNPIHTDQSISDVDITHGCCWGGGGSLRGEILAIPAPDIGVTISTAQTCAAP